jgi:hypothetical protein
LLLAVFSLVRPDGSFLVDVLPASLIAAVGSALGMAMMTAMATSQGADQLVSRV